MFIFLAGYLLLVFISAIIISFLIHNAPIMEEDEGLRKYPD